VTKSEVGVGIYFVIRFSTYLLALIALLSQTERPRGIFFEKIFLRFFTSILDLFVDCGARGGARYPILSFITLYLL